MATRKHWDRVAHPTSRTQVSWYQPEPAVSLDLIRRVAGGADAAFIDAGAGASAIVDDLLTAGYPTSVC